MIEFTGFLLIITGSVLFVFAWRGRLVNNNPHCRGCGFDLDGLPLEQTANCPECGRLITSSKAAIRYGRRKRRRGFVALACLVVLLGMSGIFWQPISRFSGLSKINWYEVLPEIMVLSMATNGNTKALDVFHDRLIPGEVSDQVLLELVEHALNLLEDESVVWDERWGNVILYAFIMEKLPEDTLFEIMERSCRTEAHIHQEIDLEIEKVPTWLYIGSLSNGRSDPNFRMELARLLNPGETFPDLPTPYQLRVETSLPHKPGPRERGGSSGAIGHHDPERPGWWLPFPGTSHGVGSEIRVSKDVDAFEAHFEARFLMYKGDQIAHEWTDSIMKQVRRVPEPDYIERVKDASRIEPVIQSITVQSILVPTQLDEARKHDQITNSSPTTLSLMTSIDEEMGLLGELWFDNGESTLQFVTIKMPKLKTNHSYGVSALHTYNQPGQTWIDWFDRNAAFWEIAIENGSVDVIYMPEPDLAATEPRMKRMIDVPIVFKGVQIRTQVPRQRKVHIGRNGPIEQRWGMEDVNQPEVGVSYSAEEHKRLFGRPDPVAGEVYKEAAEDDG